MEKEFCNVKGSDGLIVRFKVIIESQPDAFGMVSVYWPDNVYVWSLNDQVYESQAVWIYTAEEE